MKFSNSGPGRRAALFKFNLRNRNLVDDHHFVYGLSLGFQALVLPMMYNVAKPYRVACVAPAACKIGAVTGNRSDRFNGCCIGPCITGHLAVTILRFTTTLHSSAATASRCQRANRSRGRCEDRPEARPEMSQQRQPAANSANNANQRWLRTPPHPSHGTKRAAHAEQH
eukprot:SAG31_NODE_2156_length_6309_cov_30.741707_2_plen_169_part_00